MAFAASTIKKVMIAAGNECTFEGCREIMLDPNSETILGEAAHIEGDKPNSPRYNQRQTEVERQAYSNAIAMCRKHHKIIDDNQDKYPVELLREWKATHEAKHANQLDKGWFRPSSLVKVYVSEGRAISVSFWYDREGLPRVYSDRQMAISTEIRNLYVMFSQMAGLMDWISGSNPNDVSHVQVIKVEASKIAQNRQEFMEELFGYLTTLHDVTLGEFMAAMATPRPEEPNDFERVLADIAARGSKQQRERTDAIVQADPPETDSPSE